MKYILIKKKEPVLLLQSKTETESSAAKKINIQIRKQMGPEHTSTMLKK